VTRPPTRRLGTAAAALLTTAAMSTGAVVVDASAVPGLAPRPPALASIDLRTATAAQLSELLGTGG